MGFRALRPPFGEPKAGAFEYGEQIHGKIGDMEPCAGENGGRKEKFKGEGGFFSRRKRSVPNVQHRENAAGLPWGLMQRA
jgi:hypothetical protein